MRSTHKPGTLIVTIALVFLLNIPSSHAEVSNAELLARLESMQQQIDDLKLQLAQTQDKTDETDAKVEAVAEVVDSAPAQVVEASRTTIGGYGELHYNNLNAKDPARDLERLDLHRFVLFFGHQFDDKTLSPIHI